MTNPVPTVYIVDDDASVRKGLERLIRSAGLKVETFPSGENFLRSNSHSAPSCLILDVRMHGLSGIELQKKLIMAGNPLPVIFITGHGNIPMSVKAMKNGAVDFLPKPFSDEELLSAINRAIDKDIKIRAEKAEKEKFQNCLNALTPREREVLPWLLTGMLNKQIAAKLNITEKTIKVHRSRVMRKMQVESIAELVRISEKCGITPP